MTIQHAEFEGKALALRVRRSEVGCDIVLHIRIGQDTQEFEVLPLSLDTLMLISEVIRDMEITDQKATQMKLWMIQQLVAFDAASPLYAGQLIDPKVVELMNRYAVIKTD